MIDQKLFGGLFAPQRYAVFPDYFGEPRSAEHLQSMLAAQASMRTWREPCWRSINPRHKMTDEQVRLFQIGNLLSRA